MRSSGTNKKKWKEIYEENENHGKRNTTVLATVAVLVIVVIVALFVTSPGVQQTRLERDLKAIFTEASLPLPEGSRILVEFYNDNREFTGERFLITENGVTRYDGGAYDARLATREAYLPQLKEGDVCQTLHTIYLQNDYIYEESGDVSKYSTLESCVR